MAVTQLEREADAIGKWMPPGVMAAVLLVALAFLARLLLRRLDTQDNETKALRVDVAEMAKSTASEMSAIRERLPTMATREDLGRMGDRFDARITSISERIGYIERTLPAKGRKP